MPVGSAMNPTPSIAIIDAVRRPSNGDRGRSLAAQDHSRSAYSAVKTVMNRSSNEKDSRGAGARSLDGFGE